MVAYMVFLMEQILQNMTVNEVRDQSGGDAISLRRLREICYAAEESMTEPEVEKTLEYMAQWIRNEKNGSACPDEGSGSLSFFDLVDCFSARVLTMAGTEIVYRYKYSGAWHRASVHMGEDLFVTYACAVLDSRNQRRRKDFSWKWVLGHDNYELNNMLDQGISDNHYHLRVSNPYFDLSWSSLMNSVTGVNMRFLDEMNANRRNIRRAYTGKSGDSSFAVLHLKAALIRLYLYFELTGCRIEIGHYRAPVRWLLEWILKIERPKVRQKKRTGPADLLMRVKTVEECLEQIYGEADKIREEYPGFYFFFRERCAGIPISVMPDQTECFSSENIASICEYVEKTYMPFSLAETEWIFRERYSEEFHKEWRRQTGLAAERLLSDDMALMTARSAIQRGIDMIHEGIKAELKDYMSVEILRSVKEEQGRLALQGERFFLYRMFRKRYVKRGKMSGADWKWYRYFLMYLIIKNRFRRELSYNNDKIGFANFSVYQKRKDWFTTSFSEQELAKSAVEEAFYREKMLRLELRIMPGERWEDNCRNILYYDRAILDSEEKPDINSFYYVFHFGKRKDEEKGRKGLQFLCRHEKYRMALRRKVNAIILMREHNRKAAGRLRGVDACSSEDGCRPEVFAPAFRVLKNSVVSWHEEKPLPQLRLSYHVGEDNQDVLDGVRAIDEAVFFLGMGSGDRLGHATMLGTDPFEWYYRRNYRVAIRQMDYLDNIAWLFGQIVHYKLPEYPVLEYLRKEYHICFERVYCGAFERNGWHWDFKEFDIHTYYASWKLRGDDPGCYRSGRFERHPPLSLWDDYALNIKVSNDIRALKKAVLLYYAYHYSDIVYREGSKPILVEIPLPVIAGIAAVQKKMMQHIAKLGISIETNPTSNVMIAGMNGYERHPILNFYNKGLTGRTEDEDGCAQLSVSINTDDAGVFATSLRNEYSRMAWSLERMVDKEGHFYYKKDRVYDWLDRIRKMGNEQSFAGEE